jgi:ketosteroid isomerase-like protein
LLARTGRGPRFGSGECRHFTRRRYLFLSRTWVDATARFEIEQVVADCDEFVVTLNRIAGVGARSRAPLLFRWAAVFWVREGRLARVVGYLRRGEALKAVGLEE